MRSITQAALQLVMLKHAPPKKAAVFSQSWGYQKKTRAKGRASVNCANPDSQPLQTTARDICFVAHLKLDCIPTLSLPPHESVRAHVPGACVRQISSLAHPQVYSVPPKRILVGPHLLPPSLVHYYLPARLGHLFSAGLHENESSGHNVPSNSGFSNLYNSTRDSTSSSFGSHRLKIC